MGQYRLSIYAHWQFGGMIGYNGEQIKISIPFVSIHIATTKYADGVFIFGHYFG